MLSFIHCISIPLFQLNLKNFYSQVMNLHFNEETLNVINNNPFVVDPYFTKKLNLTLELPRKLHPKFIFYCQIEGVKEASIHSEKSLFCNFNVSALNSMKNVSFWINDTLGSELVFLNQFEIYFVSLHIQPSFTRFDQILHIFDFHDDLPKILKVPEAYRNYEYKLTSNHSFESTCNVEIGSLNCSIIGMKREIDLMKLNLFIQWKANTSQNFSNLIQIRQNFIIYEEKRISFPLHQDLMYYTSIQVLNLNFTLLMKLEYHENIYLKMINFKTGLESKLPLKYNSYNSSFISFSIDNFTSSSAGKKSLQLWYQDSSYLPFEFKISENALDLYFLTIGRVLSFKPAAIVFNKTMNMFISSTFDVSSVLDGNYSCKYGNEQKNYTSKAVISLTGEFNCPIIWSETLGSISLSIYFTVNEELKLVVPAEKITVVCKNFHNLFL
jgi:hypothetical protein